MNALEQVHATYARLKRKLREEGRKEGREEARKEAREEARKEAKAESLLQVLEWRFGELPEPVTARVARASKKTLDRWFARALGAATLDDIFAR